MEPTEQILALDSQRMRREVLTRRILHTLLQTIEVDPAWGTPELTDASVRAITPLVEAIDILESIIFASDGCIGHRQCVHSMEPWQRARRLLEGKWEANCDPDVRWPNPNP